MSDRCMSKVRTIVVKNNLVNGTVRSVVHSCNTPTTVNRAEIYRRDDIWPQEIS
jgi:hypothetical protein